MLEGVFCGQGDGCDDEHGDGVEMMRRRRTV